MVILDGKRRSVAKATTLAIESIPGDEPPKAFRLFKAGENETTKGVFLFDSKAAELVMAAAKERGGVEYSIDLEHLSLDPDSRNFDPDARGWFKLEVRDGELWAVNVRWTPDGVRRLSEKTQRYVSPAFMADEEGRVTEILNVALVAMPATHGTPALVAANRRTRMTPEQLRALIALLSARFATIKKLADGDGESAPAGKFAAVKAAAAKAAEALAEIDSAKGDVDASMAAVDKALAAMKECEDAIAAMTGGAAPAPAPEATSETTTEDEAEKMARDLAELRTLREEKRAKTERDRVEKLAAEKVERHQLVAKLVELGRETPATAWADENALTPRGSLATMPIEELRDRVKAFGGNVQRSVALGAGPRPPSVATGGTDSLISEDEVAYVKARHAQLKADGMQVRPIEEVLSRYLRHKAQQLKGAEAKEDLASAQHLAKPLHRGAIILAQRAGLITLAAVKPFEEMGASSQIAFQVFRTEYNLALSSEPAAWAESVGKMLPDGSLKTTYPLNFRALKFQEKTAQNAATGQPLNVDIEVSQREFFEGQQIELRRLQKGDFAYAHSWAQLAADLARARIFLRNELVAALIEANATWGVTAKQPTGIDTKAFFAADHAVNPFDASKKLRGSATFSNYQAAATPLGASNLTAEKRSAMQVAAPDGRELGIKYDGILYPSSLEQTAEDLLKIQDLIRQGGTVDGTNGVAQIRNPHFGSGMEQTRAPELAGTDLTADYYLYSRQAIARGLVPWVIAEDPTEDFRQWDENSDFFKATGHIKVESHVFLNAVLLYPHAIRKIKGA